MLGLEVVQQNTSLLALLTPISNHNARAVDDLSGVSFTVKNAQSSPFAELLAIRHLDERDFVLRAQRNDELLVGLLLACFVQDAHMSLATVECFAGFAEATGETVMDEGNFEDTCAMSILESCREIRLLYLSMHPTRTCHRCRWQSLLKLQLHRRQRRGKWALLRPTKSQCVSALDLILTLSTQAPIGTNSCKIFPVLKRPLRFGARISRDGNVDGCLPSWLYATSF